MIVIVMVGQGAVGDSGGGIGTQGGCDSADMSGAAPVAGHAVQDRIVGQLSQVPGRGSTEAIYRLVGIGDEDQW